MAVRKGKFLVNFLVNSRAGFLVLSGCNEIHCLSGGRGQTTTRVKTASLITHSIPISFTLYVRYW